MNIFKDIYFQLLLLQLEEYDLVRYLRTVYNTGLKSPALPARKPLVWTAKIKLTLTGSLVVLTVFAAALLIGGFSVAKLLIVLTLLTALYFRFGFIFFALATLLLSPIDFVAKNMTIFRAKMKIKKFKNLKIIGIAGSYGKTGMKEFVATVLAQKYNVLKTPESYNTPYAIAQLILRKLDEETEIFVVEMGEYYKGDIENICSIARPNVAIITGINEAHLERLGNIQNTIATIFEIVQNMDENGSVLVNVKDDLVKNNYRKFVSTEEIYFYKNKNDFEFDESIPGYVIRVGKSKVFFPLLGSYNLDKIDAVLFLAKKFKLSETQIISGIKNLIAVPHRLQPIVNKDANVLIIDDSYNGNPDGVREAISTLALFKKKRKIYVTPGLVEMGEKAKNIHYNIGKKLVKGADLVVLIKNSVTPEIARGLIEGGFEEKNIIWFQSGTEAYNSLKGMMRSGDVVLLQNDWPDNYI